MRKTFCLAAAGLFVLSGTLVRAAPFRATVYTTDGQKLNGLITMDSFNIRTAYGTLAVPTKDIAAIYPGFRVGDSTRRRIAALIARLTTAKKDYAARDLAYMGRIAVPQLQAAARSKDKALARQAKDLLKKTWPTGAHVPSDGSGILRTKKTEFRGTLTFLNIRIAGAFGRKTLRKSAIRLVQFSKSKVQPATDTPQHPPAKGGENPQLELTMRDNSRILGTLDTYSLTVKTDYGKLTVPLNDLISVILGDPDEIVTRKMAFTGKLSTTTLNVKSKVGAFNLDRDKVSFVKAVLDETGATVVAGGPVKPSQWTRIFNGKNLRGWSNWGSGSKKVERGTIRLVGDAGLTYQNMMDVHNVILAARVKINKFTGPGGGIKLTLRDGAAGTYFTHFSGRAGTIFKWDNKTSKSTSLKKFTTDPPTDQWHSLQFGIIETMMIVYVNGKPAARVTIPAAGALPPGKVSIGVWNCDANFRDIQVKVIE